MDYATPNSSAIKEDEEKEATVLTTTSTITSKTADLRQQFRSYAGDKASTLKEEAGNKATVVKQAATEKYEHTKAKAKDVHASSEDYIREHPTKCILGAFGVGLLIGLLARRR